jgi:4-hydroxybenzoate polyprenyltransferase
MTLEMIRWEHSIFALPFALTGAMLAARGIPRVGTLGWILLAMVSARSAAMAFNRLADAKLDANNPRTKNRALPTGLLSTHFVGWFTGIASLIFIIAAWRLNRLTLMLAPVALIVLLGYSWTKRFTRWSHLILGLALGIAPSAAWIAVRGSLDKRIVVLTGAVLLWVAGFDILYACQDFEHDRSAGLNSVPQAFGLNAAFWLARLFHVGMLGLLVWMCMLFALGPIAYAGVALVAGLLLYEHLIVSPTDLSRMDAAFFTMNGVIAFVFFAAVATALLMRG